MATATDDVIELTPDRGDKLDELAADGYVYAATSGEGTTYLARTAGALVAMDIDGYGDLPDTDEGHDEATGARYERLVGLGNALQDWFADNAVEAGTFSPATESEDVLTALLSDKTTPFDGIPTGPGRVNRDWSHEVPIVLIATDYSPFTERETPTGNVLWLDPSTEVTYMRSLARVGVLEFRVHGE